MDPNSIKSRFVPRRGFFNQPYFSVRLRNCEITLDNLLPRYCYQLSICTPYNERADKASHKRGVGAGEVKRWWYFEDEDKVYDFIAKNELLCKMIMV